MIMPEADKPAGGGQDSRQGIVKKKQETIFEKSIGSMRHFKKFETLSLGTILFRKAHRKHRAGGLANNAIRRRSNK
jgi:hypothetical protein